MALRIGLRRASRLCAYNSFLRAALATDSFAASQSAITVVGRACFESRLPNSTIRVSSLSHFRSFCSEKDVDSRSNAINVTNAETNAETKAGEEEEESSKPSKRHDLAMLFTCKVCETRSAKTMSRATYETGIVIVRCPKCRNLHLIADRLGWFGEAGSVEDFLEQQGVSVRKGLEASYEFSVDDLAGWSPPKE